MALRKRIYEDKIEVVGEVKNIQVRTATVIEEGTDAKGYEEISCTYHRHALASVSSSQDSDGKWTHTDTDISSESDEVKNIANVVWTDSVKALLKAKNEQSGV